MLNKIGCHGSGLQIDQTTIRFGRYAYCD